jgi:hypothetical protein
VVFPLLAYVSAYSHTLYAWLIVYFRYLEGPPTKRKAHFFCDHGSCNHATGSGLTRKALYFHQKEEHMTDFTEACNNPIAAATVAAQGSQELALAHAATTAQYPQTGRGVAIICTTCQASFSSAGLLNGHRLKTGHDTEHATQFPFEQLQIEAGKARAAAAAQRQAARQTAKEQHAGGAFPLHPPVTGPSTWSRDTWTARSIQPEGYVLPPISYQFTTQSRPSQYSSQPSASLGIQQPQQQPASGWQARANATRAPHLADGAFTFSGPRILIYSTCSQINGNKANIELPMNGTGATQSMVQCSKLGTQSTARTVEFALRRQPSAVSLTIDYPMSRSSVCY